MLWGCVYKWNTTQAVWTETGPWVFKKILGTFKGICSEYSQIGPVPMPQLANCWQSSTSAIFIQVPPTPTIGEVKDSDH